MRKTTVFAALGSLLAIVVVLAWIASQHSGHPETVTAQLPGKQAGAVHRRDGFPPPPAPIVRESTIKPVLRIPEIGTLETARLSQAWTAWFRSHGCAPRETGIAWVEPMNRLRLEALNGDLTAATELGEQLLFDGNHDHRAQAKR
ncbi:MAG: hypothetical protein ACRETQ_02330, partial [Gammaproteobacteria bacterium]